MAKSQQELEDDQILNYMRSTKNGLSDINIFAGGIARCAEAIETYHRRADRVAEIERRREPASKNIDEN